MASESGPVRNDLHTRKAGRRLACALGALFIAHVTVAWAWPILTGTAGNPVLHLAWFVADFFAASSILLILPSLRPVQLAAYAAGYAIMVWLLWPLISLMQENLLILVITTMLYGGLARHPRLLGYLYIFLIAQRFLPAYLYPVFLLGALLYTTIPPFIALWRQYDRLLPLFHAAGLLFLMALLLPVIMYVSQSSPQSLRQRLTEPEVISALIVSLRTSLSTTLIVLLLGVPLAYVMVRTRFPGRRLLDTLIDLPIVIPPPIAGLTLLAFVGPKSPLGEFLDARGGVQFFDRQPGIVLAQLFVSSPFLIRASMVAFSGVDLRIENVARTLGASSFSVFVRVTLPLAWRGILIGVILTWFRAMAEFGSLKIMANRPMTMPILAYERFIEYGQTEARSIGALILVMCLSVAAGMWFLRALPGAVREQTGAADAAH
jgi:molybdate/tungstate transport system permease protein